MILVLSCSNKDNTGIWTVSYYADDFGEPTKKGYIQNKNLISGLFSNTNIAAHNSSLNVGILISSADDISLKLFCGLTGKPLHNYLGLLDGNYRVLIQDNDGNRYELTATSYSDSDRLSFDKTTSNKVHNILMNGGSIKFKVIESKMPTNEYMFTILKADWYENAYKKLLES